MTHDHGDKRLKDIALKALNGWRSWVQDHLEGTRYYEQDVKEIDDLIAEVNSAQNQNCEELCSTESPSQASTRDELEKQFMKSKLDQRLKLFPDRDCKFPSFEEIFKLGFNDALDFRDSLESLPGTFDRDWLFKAYEKAVLSWRNQHPELDSYDAPDLMGNLFIAKSIDDLDLGTETDTSPSNLQTEPLNERILKSLDGVAAVNLDEPSAGDLERVTEGYRKARERIAELESENAKLKIDRSILRCGECGNHAMWNAGIHYINDLDNENRSLKARLEEALNKYCELAKELL